MKKINVLCLATLLFGVVTTINNENNKIELYDNLYELNSDKTPKKVNEIDNNALLNVSDVKVQTTILEENQTRDMRFVAAIDSLDYL